MSKTIDDLEECCNQNLIPPIPVLADYFGLHNLSNYDNYNLCIFLGLYNK
jgi:hypothetical protein